MPKLIQFEGQTHSFPDDFSDQDISSALEQPKQSGMRAAAIGGTQGATFGFGDEISGLASASGLPVGTPPLLTIPVGAYRRLTGAQGAEDAYKSGRDAFRSAESRAETERPYSTLAGRVMGILAGSAIPLGVAGRGATLAGTSARSAGIGAGLGAVQGAGDAKELSDVPQEAATGAAVGAGVGAVAPFALHGFSKLLSPFAGISAERQASVNTLRSHGVTDITPGQQTGSQALRFFESENARGTTQRIAEKQGEQFTRAALATVGEDANRATPEVLDRAYTRIGGVFDGVAKNTRIIADPQLAYDFVNVQREFNQITNPSTRAPIVQNTIDGIISKIRQNGGVLPSEFYQAERSKLGKLASKTKDNELSDALYGIQGALDDVMERSASPTDIAALKEARGQYRNLLAITKAASAAGENTAEGIIAPNYLKNAVKAQGVKSYATGRRDIGELARAGVNVMTPLANSNTAARLAAQGLTKSVFGLGGGLTGNEYGGGTGFTAGAIAGMVLPNAVARAALSGLGRRYLTNQLTTGYRPLSELGLIAAQPARGELIERR